MGWTFGVGDVLNIFLAASLASGFFSLFLLHLYRRRVRRMARSDATVAERTSPAYSAGIRSMEYRRADSIGAPSEVHGQIRHRRLLHLRMYVVSGVIYAIAATVAVSFLFEVSGPGLLLFFAATYCWPPLVAVDVAFESRGRLRIIGAYLAVLSVSSALLPLAATASQPIGTVPPLAWGPFIWGAAMIVPTVLLGPVLAPGLRAVGPTMLSLFVVTLALFRVALSSPGDAFGVWDRIVGAIFGELRLSLVMGLFLGLILLLCLSVGVAAAWLVGRWHRAKYFSDQSLTVSAIVMIYTLWLLLLSSALEWRLSRLSVVFVFAAFVFTLSVQRRLAPRPESGLRLLLLRAFDPDCPRWHRKFFRALQSDWRYVGPLQIVAGPDLATETVEPARFLRFLGGNLRSLYISDPSEVRPAIETLDEKPDPDGRFRINELFCKGPVWRAVVADLARRSAFVMMDVSNFNRQKGLTDELHMLAQVVDLQRVTFLVGGPEETARFRQELAHGVACAPAGSPNASGPVQVQEVEVEGRPADAVDRILGSLHTAVPHGGHIQGGHV